MLWLDYCEQHGGLKTILNLYSPRPEMLTDNGLKQTVKLRGMDEGVELTFDKEFIKYKIASMLYSANAREDDATDILQNINDNYAKYFNEIDDERLEQKLKQLQRTGLTREEILELAEKI